MSNPGTKKDLLLKINCMDSVTNQIMILIVRINKMLKNWMLYRWKILQKIMFDVDTVVRYERDMC